MKSTTNQNQALTKVDPQDSHKPLRGLSFSLIELIIVLLFISTLGVWAAVRTMRSVDSTKFRSDCKALQERVYSALDLAQLTNGSVTLIINREIKRTPSGKTKQTYLTTALSGTQFTEKAGRVGGLVAKLQTQGLIPALKDQTFHKFPIKLTFNAAGECILETEKPVHITELLIYPPTTNAQPAIIMLARPTYVDPSLSEHMYKYIPISKKQTQAPNNQG